MPDPASKPWTAAQFFAWQSSQKDRYELVSGFPIRMIAGAPNVHDDIVVNLLAELRGQLRGSGCRPFTGDGSIETLTGQIRRPDAGVDCGQCDPDGMKAALPRMVAEVLSPSTRDFDTFEKLAEYKQAGSLEYIVVVEPNAPEVVAWSRDPGRDWVRHVLEGLGREVDMPAIGVTLPLTEIYGGVAFPSRPRLVRREEVGAIAHQDWYRLRADRYEKDNRPWIPGADFIAKVKKDRDLSLSEEPKSRWIERIEKYQSGNVFMEGGEWEPFPLKVNNLYLSRCFSCEELAVWVSDAVLFPNYGFHIDPNRDLPDEIKANFVEATKILDASPRGSAALLRLCIQKLCKHLGKSGRDINGDIATLVKNGLDVRIQKSLDIVRVVGNNAVHPGQYDMTDDRDTASRFFRLVNMIADALITQPKHVDEFYEALPETSKLQIAKTDAPKT
jgi:Uma2 family endonuclease